MSTILNDELKTRVPEKVKAQLETIAAERGLKVADIVREALTKYLREQQSKEQNPLAA